MSWDAISLGLDIAPIGIDAINRTLGRTEVARLFEHLDAAVSQSNAIPAASRRVVRKKVSGLRVDPTFGGCLLVLLDRGDVPVEPTMRERLGELLSFGDEMIDDSAIVDLVFRAVVENMHRAPRSERDAAHIEHGRTRAGLEDVKRHVSEEVASLGGQLATAPELKLPVRFNLPLVAAAFTGRDAELDALHRALGAEDRAVITQSVTGLGGVGKSQLAARYVQRYADGHDIVAWIHAEEGGIADVAALATRLGIPGGELSPNALAHAALEWLGATELRWLLVLDNIQAPAQLVQLLPRSGGGRVLATSRDRSLREFGPRLTVDVFDEETAAAFLVERSGRTHDSSAARELAGALGGLPLALSHAAAYCEDGTSFTDYLKELRDLPARELFDTHPEESYTRTVASTWKTSIDAACMTAPLAADVLEMSAYLAPDAIPRALFEELGERDAPRGRRRRQLRAAIKALSRYSLAGVDDDTLAVHRLLQKVVREGIGERADKVPALRALAALDLAFPIDVDRPERWPRCERLLPHILALAERPAPSAAGWRALVGMLNRASAYLHYAEPGRRGLSVAMAALELAEEDLGMEHTYTLDARDNLARAHLDAGSAEDAIPIFELQVTEAERIIGAEHGATLAYRNNLADTYREAGRAGDAISICEPLLADVHRLLGSDHTLTLNVRGNLAMAYHEGGWIAEAMPRFEALATAYERTLGRLHPSTLNTRTNLLACYIAEGRSADIVDRLRAHAADVELVVGTDHPSTIIARGNLGHAYRVSGLARDAIMTLEPLLAPADRILGLNHPTTAIIRDNLALAHEVAERSEDADPLQKKSDP